MNVAPVSVIIPFYNGNSFLSRALKSVSAQHMLPAEVIIVNDGSREAPVFGGVDAVVPVRVIDHAQNRGTAAARNTGVAAALQPWVAFLDQDDEWLPHRVQSQWQLIEDGGDDRRTVYYGRAWRALTMNPDDDVAWPRLSVAARLDRSAESAVAELVLHGNPLPFITVLAPQDAVNGRFNESLRGGSDDYALLLELAAEGFRFRLASPESPIARRYETGFNQSEPRRFLVDDLAILDALGAAHPETGSLLRRGRAAAHYRAARGLLEQAPGEAFRHARAALRLNRLSARTWAVAIAAAGPAPLRRIVSDVWTHARRRRYRAPGSGE